LKYRAEIDGLRAVAVASVLLFHLGFSTFSGGFVGVDVFFVISGYLITGIISEEVAETGTFDFGNFYLRRLRRLFPALLATVAISLPFAFWLLSPLNFKEFGGSAVTAIISASNIYFWSLVDYFNTANITKPLLHTWSLSVEEQFYLVWPALITFLTLRKWPVSFFLIALGAVSLLANLPLTSGHVSTIFYWMPFRVFEFVLGAIVLWLPAVESSKIRSMLSLVGLALIATAVVIYTEKTIFPSVHAIAPCLGAACLIYGGKNFAANALVGNALSVFVGKISYSLYLVHWPVIVFYRYYTFEPPTLIAQLSLIVLCVVGACLLHFVVERPFHRGTFQVPNRAFALTCATGAIALIIPSASIWAGDGWLWRFPKPVADQLAFKVDTFHKYVWNELDRRAQTFANNSKPKLLVIGDSQAGDLVNLLVSSGIADKTDLRTIPIRHDCKPIVPHDASIYQLNVPAYASQCEAQLAALKSNPDLKEADTVILASSWTDWSIDHIPETISYLNHEAAKRVFVLGNKQQIMTGVQFLATYGVRPNSAAFKDKPAHETLEANSRIKSLKAPFRFLDPLDLFCTDGACSIVSKSGFLIIYDNLHLTPMGVEYLGPRVASAWGVEIIGRAEFGETY